MDSIKFFFLFVVLVLGVMLNSATTLGAPCCARSAAAPFLILGQDEYQLNFGLTAASSVAEAYEGKTYFAAPQDSDFATNFRMDGAMLLSDRFQFGTSLSLINRNIQSDGISTSAFGVGDVRLSFGYEVLPNWTYSAWKPQGFLFAVVNLPTGKSAYEIESQSSIAESTGNGFYSLSVGTIFVKRWNVWDAFAIGELHYSLPRTFDNSLGPMTVVPGWGGSLGAGVGLSPGGGAFRVGLRLQPRLDQPRPIDFATGIPQSTLATGQTGAISVCDTGLDLSYMLGTSDTFMLSYTDQTLLGSAANTNLTRALAFNFQHRWER